MEERFKTPEECKTIMTEMIMPNDTNPLGKLMGGILMRWLDIVGAICAGKHCESNVVTASVDHISFQHGIDEGDVITLIAKVTRAWGSSMEVYVEVFTNNIAGLNNRKTNHAYLTFVGVNPQTLKPIKVPKIEPITDDEKEKYDSAARRREVRLILSGRMKKEESIELKDYFANIKS